MSERSKHFLTVTNRRIERLENGTGNVTSVNGRVGDVTLDKTDVGLGNVDNTSDLNKPISSATQYALDGKQPNLVNRVNIELGRDLTGDRYSFIDFHSNDTNTDYASRIVRNPGINTNLDIYNVGTGAVNILQNSTIAQSITGAHHHLYRSVKVLDGASPLLQLVPQSAGGYPQFNILGSDGLSNFLIFNNDNTGDSYLRSYYADGSAVATQMEFKSDQALLNLSGKFVATQTIRSALGFAMGADDDVYLYASSPTEASMRTGSSGAYKYFTFEDDGNILLVSNPTPTQNNHVTPKQYVDPLYSNHGGESDSDTSAINIVGGGTINKADNLIWAQLGTPTTPDATASYKYKAIHAEVNSDSVVPAISTWGNSQKAPAILGEFLAYDGFTGEANGAAFRAYSNDAVTNASNYWLVGMSAVGQTNTGAGNDSFDVWGGNFVAAQTSGNAPQNVVGIEVDLVHDSNATPTIGGTNYTAFWAQADGYSAASNSAFRATKTVQSSGWYEILQGHTDCFNACIDVSNTLNSPTAHGILVETLYNAPGVDVIRATCNSTVHFKVDGDPANPVWLRVGSALKQVTVGAVNSGGTGYRMLRVLN